jgi:hypothetical protein
MILAENAIIKLNVMWQHSMDISVNILHDDSLMDTGMKISLDKILTIA